MNTPTNVNLLRLVDGSRFPLNNRSPTGISDRLKTTTIPGRRAIQVQPPPSPTRGARIRSERDNNEHWLIRADLERHFVYPYQKIVLRRHTVGYRRGLPKLLSDA